jgi:hypothetical protein
VPGHVGEGRIDHGFQRLFVVAPQAVPLTDIIGGSFMCLWLTADEARGPRIAPPKDHREGVDAAAFIVGSAPDALLSGE